jgi:hypothetical protein
MRRQTAKITEDTRSAQEPAIDTATIDLLAEWRRLDATDDPDLIRAAEEELAEFERAMNENRALVGARLLFP